MTSAAFVTWRSGAQDLGPFMMKLLQSACQMPGALVARCAQDDTFVHSEMPVCAIILDCMTAALGADHLVCSQVCKGQGCCLELLGAMATQGLDRAAYKLFKQEYTLLKPFISLIGASQMKGCFAFCMHPKSVRHEFGDQGLQLPALHQTETYRSDTV